MYSGCYHAFTSRVSLYYCIEHRRPRQNARMKLNIPASRYTRSLRTRRLLFTRFITFYRAPPQTLAQTIRDAFPVAGVGIRNEIPRERLKTKGARFPQRMQVMRVASTHARTHACSPRNKSREVSEAKAAHCSRSRRNFRASSRAPAGLSIMNSDRAMH